MLQSHHYESLNKLRNSTSTDDRKEAQRRLMDLESQGLFGCNELEMLLADDDPVFQIYAIEAIGRLQLKDISDKLIGLYKVSENPFVLCSLLATFIALSTDVFKKIVLEKLKKTAKKEAGKARGRQTNVWFDNETIHDQIIIPSLRYLKEYGDAKIEKGIKPYLSDDDPNVRWNALVVFDRLSIPVKPRILADIRENDPAVLVREQAAIMIDRIH